MNAAYVSGACTEIDNLQTRGSWRQQTRRYRKVKREIPPIEALAGGGTTRRPTHSP